MEKILGRRFLLGVDLAKSMDFTSFAVIEMCFDPAIGDSVYHLVGLDRIRGVEYPIITKLIIDAFKSLSGQYVQDGPHLCMDASGLGAPIRDYLKQADLFDYYKRSLFPVVFTGGESARFNPTSGNYNVSKTLIFSNLVSLMQHKRFDYAQDLQALPMLEEEITNFKYHLTASGHTTMDAVSGKHDDLLCCIAIPLMIAEWKYRDQAGMFENIDLPR